MLHVRDAETDLTSSIDQQQPNRLHCPLNEIKKSWFSYWPPIVADGKADDGRYANVCKN